jgi:protein phosphatase-4 regulatory subunit 3
LNRLVLLFGDLEDLDDNDNLCHIAIICRNIFTLNDPTLIELIISDKMFINIAGIMEFDPLLKSRGDYRVYLTSKVQFRQVVPITNQELKNSIDTLFRLKFTRDILLRPSFDESGMSALNSMIVFANSDICTQVFESIEYLSLVIKAIDSNVDISSFITIDENSPTESIENSEINLKSRDSGLRFLRELFNMARSLHFEKRIGLISEMLKSLQIPFFTMVKSILASDNCSENERICIAELIVSVTLACPASVRQVILEGSIPSYPPHVTTGRVQQHQTQNSSLLSQNNQCLLYLMIQRLIEENNCAVIEHLGDSIRILLDPERIDRRDKEKFLGVFYDYYMQWLLVPFVDPNVPDQPTHSRYLQDNSAIATSRRFILEILSFCSQFHSYRMKCFVMRNSVLQRVSRIFDSPQRHFHLGAIRLIRTILSCKDEVYFRYIVKFDLLKSIMLLLQKCSKKDNLLTSTIVEMIDFIRTESLNTLIDYIVEKYSSSFDDIDHVDVFDRLKLKYEQSRDTSMSNGISNGNNYLGDNGSETDVSVYSKKNKNSSIQNRRFIEQDSEEAYFNEEDDDEDDDNDRFLENNQDDSQISSKIYLNNPLSMISQYCDDVNEESVAESSIINSSVINNQLQNINGDASSIYASSVIKSLCQKRVSEDMFSTDENTLTVNKISKKQEILQYEIDDVQLPPQRVIDDDGDLPSSAFLAGKNSKNNINVSNNSSVEDNNSKKKSEGDNNGVSLIRFSMKPTKKSVSLFF